MRNTKMYNERNIYIYNLNKKLIKTERSKEIKRKKNNDRNNNNKKKKKN